MNKQSGALLQVMSMAKIVGFIAQVKKLELMCGLAGSLRLEDIPVLLPNKVDYLGFRGALCEGQNRSGQLNKQAVMQIKELIQCVGC